MLTLLAYWVLTALILMLISALLPGITITGFGAALIATFFMGLINITLRPILLLLTLPVTILTLGLFALVINAMMFGLAAWLVPGFAVASGFSALIGSILMALMVSLIDGLKTHPA